MTRIRVYPAIRTWHGIADDEVVFVAPEENDDPASAPIPLVRRTPRTVRVLGITPAPESAPGHAP